MHNENDEKKLKIEEDETEQDSGSGDSGQVGTGGQGGVGGKIHFRFRDAASLPPRDDVLPPTEIKRLLTVQSGLHKDRVDKQKLTRKERAAIKAGKKHLVSNYTQGLGQGNFGGSSRFKQHPITNKAQFSGIDKQTIGLPTEFDAETNAEMRDRLENRFQHRNVPKFNPKPRPMGG